MTTTLATGENQYLTDNEPFKSHCMIQKKAI